MKGPNYISWREWQALQRVRRSKVVRVSGLLIACGAAVLAGVILIPPTVASAKAKRLANALASIDSYQARIVAYDPANTTSSHVFRNEIITPTASRTELWDGSIVILQSKGRTVVEEPNAGVVRMHSAWIGPVATMKMLAQKLEKASRWSIGSSAFQTLGRDAQGRNGARIIEPFTRTTVWTDPQTDRPLECSIDFKDFQGWEAAEDIQFSYAPANGTISIPELNPKFQSLHPSSQPATSFDLGETRRTVRQLDANEQGSVFVVIDSLLPSAKVTLEGAAAQRAYGVNIARLGQHAAVRTNAEPASTVLLLTRIDGSTKPFPIKLHLSFREPMPDYTGVGDLDLAFANPTCAMVPDMDGPVGSEFSWYRYLADAAGMRASDFLTGGDENNFSPANGFELINAENREKAITQLQEKIFYTRLAGGDQSPSDQTISASWLTIYEVLRSLGRGDQAKAALELAADNLDPDARGDVVLRVRRAQQDERLSGPQ